MLGVMPVIDFSAITDKQIYRLAALDDPAARKEICRRYRECLTTIWKDQTLEKEKRKKSLPGKALLAATLKYQQKIVLQFDQEVKTYWRQLIEGMIQNPEL